MMGLLTFLTPKDKKEKRSKEMNMIGGGHHQLITIVILYDLKNKSASMMSA